MEKRFLAILAAIVLIFVGTIAISKNSGNKNNPKTNNAAQPTSHIEGQGTTGVKLVEYGDYQCPICYEYYPSLKQVADKYSQQIYFQFRNLPLVQIHPNAFAAARAAEAAGLQNKYWQMHDMLYQNQDPTSKSGWVSSSSPLNFFDQFAQQIGLNMNKFDQDYSSSPVNDAINNDLASFNKTGQAHATPTFFLDGKYIPNTSLVDQNGPSLTAFSKVIDAEIAAKTKH